MRNAPVVWLLLGSIAAAQEGAPAGTSAEADPLPIKRVVLYKHGIGYFEREGRVDGRAQVTLRFQQEQMSDVLKSLTVLDLDGGRIQAIAYDSQKPASQLLEEFGFDLRVPDVRKALLEQLRGAEVELEIAGRAVQQGSVVGLDTRVVHDQDGSRHEEVQVSLLAGTGAIVTAPLSDVRSIRFLDAGLAADVGRFLALLRTTHRRDQKTVELLCDGEGSRRLFAAYTVEQPVWKATYRLVLGERQEPPFLQGWAVVDNPSDEDWSDVELSLVAGLPVSFRLDLYTPQYQERPLLVLEQDASVSFSGLRDRDKGDGVEVARRLRELGYTAADAAPAPAAEAKRAGAKLGRAAVDDAMREQQAEIIAREVGDLLVYRIDHTVSIPRHRSALLPIVSAPVEGGRVALYNEAARAGNPMSALRLVNTTGLTLEGGPATVLEGDTYAGETLLEALKPGETRYVPYAVELGIRATTEYGSESERVARVTVANGVLWSFYKDVSRKTYSFDNRNDAPRTVLVEHPRRNGFDLRSPAPKETELDRWRFEVPLDAHARGQVTVVEEAPRQASIQVSNIDSEMLLVLQRERRLSPELESFLREVVAAKGAIAGLDGEIRRIDQDLRDVAQDQERVRQNLEALGDSAEEKDLRKSYVDQLRRDEERVQALKGRRAELQAEIASRRQALDERIRAAAFDVDLGG